MPAFVCLLSMLHVVALLHVLPSPLFLRFVAWHLLDKQNRATYADSVQLWNYIHVALQFLFQWISFWGLEWQIKLHGYLLKCYEPDHILLLSVKTSEWWLMTNDKHRHHAAVAWQPRTRLPTQTTRKRSSNRPPQILKLGFFQTTQSRHILLLTSKIRQQDASPSEENLKIS